MVRMRATKLWRAAAGRGISNQQMGESEAGGQWHVAGKGTRYLHTTPPHSAGSQLLSGPLQTALLVAATPEKEATR